MEKIKVFIKRSVTNEHNDPDLPITAEKLRLIGDLAGSKGNMTQEQKQRLKKNLMAHQNIISKSGK